MPPDTPFRGLIFSSGVSGRLRSRLEERPCVSPTVRGAFWLLVRRLCEKRPAEVERIVKDYFESENPFGLTSKTALVSFLITFGMVKVLCNFFAGPISKEPGAQTALLCLARSLGFPCPS